MASSACGTPRTLLGCPARSSQPVCEQTVQLSTHSSAALGTQGASPTRAAFPPSSNGLLSARSRSPGELQQQGGRQCAGPMLCSAIPREQDPMWALHQLVNQFVSSAEKRAALTDALERVAGMCHSKRNGHIWVRLMHFLIRTAAIVQAGKQQPLDVGVRVTHVSKSVCRGHPAGNLAWT
jgi:hypothetical protein